MKNGSKRLGVIGGCGILAGIDFLSRLDRKFINFGLIEEFDRPEVVMINVNHAPSRINFAEGNGTSFVESFINAGNQMKTCDASVCCIVCNTAHLAIDSIVSGVGLPFVDMIFETANYIKNLHDNVKKIGVLCSSGSSHLKLFNKYFDNMMPDVEIIYPNALTQLLVNEGIRLAKTDDVFENRNSIAEKFLCAIEHLILSEADCIILGCTEISVILNAKEYQSVPIIDSLDVLVDACASKFVLSVDK